MTSRHSEGSPLPRHRRSFVACACLRWHGGQPSAPALRLGQCRASAITTRCFCPPESPGRTLQTSLPGCSLCNAILSTRWQQGVCQIPRPLDTGVALPLHREHSRVDSRCVSHLCGHVDDWHDAAAGNRNRRILHASRREAGQNLPQSMSLGICPRVRKGPHVGKLLRAKVFLEPRHSRDYHNVSLGRRA